MSSVRTRKSRKNAKIWKLRMPKFWRNKKLTKKWWVKRAKTFLNYKVQLNNCIMIFWNWLSYSKNRWRRSRVISKSKLIILWKLSRNKKPRQKKTRKHKLSKLKRQERVLVQLKLSLKHKNNLSLIKCHKNQILKFLKKSDIFWKTVKCSEDFQTSSFWPLFIQITPRRWRPKLIKNESRP